MKQPLSKPPIQGGSKRIWLAVIVVLYVFFAIAYNVVTPAASLFQHNPDENDHAKYVSVLASGHLPVFTTAPAGSEFHQPPLYYLLCTPVYLATHGQGDSAAIHAMRAVSTVLGLLLILAVYRCVRRLFPDEPWIALLSAGFVGLLPMNIATNASVGNDSLTNLLVALGLMLTVDIAMTPETDTIPARKPALLGLVLGAVILTKSSGLVLYPTVVVAFLALAYRKAMPQSTALRCLGIALGIGLLIGCPWLLRNMSLYGDPLGQKVFNAAFKATTAPADAIIIGVHGFGNYVALMTKWTFASFWGVFDSMTAFWGRDPHPVHSHVPPYPIIGPPFDEPLATVYNLLAVLTGMAIIGVVAGVKRAGVDVARSSILWSFLLLLLATAYGFAMFTMQFFQAQGRYWFTALVPLAVFFALGYRGLFAKETSYRVVSIVLILGLVALNAYTIWGLLVPRFANS